MRIFYALTFEEHTKQSLTAYRDLIADSSLKGRFTRPENFHLTLEFIGEVNDEQLHILLEILEQLTAEKMILTGSYIGSFKKRDREIVWMGFEKNEVLIRMQRALAGRLREEGFGLQHQKYRPHITLGRQVLLAESLESLLIEPFKIKPVSVALMESKRLGGQLVYEVIEEVTI